MLGHNHIVPTQREDQYCHQLLKALSKVIPLETDEKNRNFARLKLLDDRLALDCLAGELHVANAGCFALLFDDREHASELREDQREAPSVRKLLELDHEPLELCRLLDLRRLWRLDEPWIAATLPQSG